jgi:hypothetical protein
MSYSRLIDSHNHDEQIDNEQTLKEFLILKRSQDPQVLLLEIPDLGILTIGIGPQCGFVEYMSSSKEPPYLLALESEINLPKDEFFEFDSGGTLTPIPGDKCIPVELVIRVAMDFYINKKLPDYVKWEEE